MEDLVRDDVVDDRVGTRRPGYGRERGETTGKFEDFGRPRVNRKFAANLSTRDRVTDEIKRPVGRPQQY